MGKMLNMEEGSFFPPEVSSCVLLKHAFRPHIMSVLQPIHDYRLRIT